MTLSPTTGISTRYGISGGPGISPFPGISQWISTCAYPLSEDVSIIPGAIPMTVTGSDMQTASYTTQATGTEYNAYALPAGLATFSLTSGIRQWGWTGISVPLVGTSYSLTYMHLAATDVSGVNRLQISLSSLYSGSLKCRMIVMDSDSVTTTVDTATTPSAVWIVQDCDAATARVFADYGAGPVEITLTGDAMTAGATALFCYVQQLAAMPAEYEAQTMGATLVTAAWDMPLCDYNATDPCGNAITARPAATRYVSQSDTNGYAVGANSGSGNSKSAPWLTIEYAIANASENDVIYVNDGEYSATTTYSIGKSITFVAQNKHAASFKAASGQVRLGVITASSDITVRFYDFLKDGYSNTPFSWRIGSSALTSTLTTEFYGCRFKNFTSFLLQSNSQKKLNLKIEGCSADGSWSGLTLVPVPAHESGRIHVNGFDVNGTMTSTSTKSVLEITSVTGTTTSRVSGLRGEVTATQATGGLYGVLTYNYDGSLVEGCDMTLNATAAGALYWIRCTSGSLTANNGVIRHSGGHANFGGGYCAIIGQDLSSAGDGRQNNGKIYGNSFTANADAALPIHGVMIGYGTGGEIYDNVVDRAALGAIAKQQVGGDIYNNTISNFGSEALRGKGVNGTKFRNNVLTATDAAPADIININENGATVSTGVEVSGNVLNVNASVDNIVHVEVGSDAAFSYNTYNVNATVPADAWLYNGTGYGTLAAWKAAVEPTALP